MPSDKIDLRTSLEDSPQVQAQVSQLEESILPMKDCTTLLRDTFQACSVHQQKVCEGTDTLTKLLNSFQEDSFSENDSFLSGAFSRLGRYLTELHSCQDMLSTQLENAVIELLSQFISNDFTELEKLKESYDAAWQEHEQATVKFSRVSKKKDSEKSRFEANSDLFTARKKYYESCLEYYSRLNGFKLKWKYSLMEPLLTYMHAQMAYFKAGHEVLNKEFGKVLNEMNTEVQRFHTQYQQDMATMAEEREEIELCYPSLCLPDPDPNDPFTDYHPPKTTITSKSGYLFLKGQKSGFLSQWERGYFYTKKGTLYSHFPQKAPEQVVSLRTAEASIAEVDDRRYVLQITSSAPGKKRSWYLMAENDAERDEWIATVNNSAQERGANQPNVPGASKDAENIRLERDRIRHWVKKEIHDKPNKRDRSSTTSRIRPNTHSAPNLAISRPSKSPTLLPRHPKPPPKRSEGPFPFSPPPAQLPSPLQPEKVQVTGPQSTSAVVPSKKFSVKYLGHTEIKDGNAPNVITDTICKVMAARSVKNVKSAVDIEMTIASKSIVFMDLGARKAIGQIQLKGVLRSSTHPDNPKLLGVVNRSITDFDKQRYICHVLESEFEGSKICKVIDDSVQAALKNPDPLPIPPRVPKRPTGPKSSSHSKEYSNSFGGYIPTSLQPKRPPPPVFRPSSSSSGYVTFDNDQVLAANAKSTHTEPAQYDLLPPVVRPHPLPPPPSSSSSSRSSSADLLTVDNMADQGLGQPLPDQKFSDGLTEDGDSFSQDLDDLPSLDSPPPMMTSRAPDPSYISDSTYTLTPPSSIDTSFTDGTLDSGVGYEAKNGTGTGYYTQGINNAASANDESVWSNGQNTSSDSGYYKVDGSVASTAGEPQNTNEDFDLFQDTFTNTSSADTFLSNQQPFSSSSTNNSGYYTPGKTTQPSSSTGTSIKQQQLPPQSSTYGTATFSAADTTNKLDEEFDLGEPVDLLSNLSEPFNNGSNFQANFSTSSSTSQNNTSGFYHTDASSVTSGPDYFSTSSSMVGDFPSTSSNMGDFPTSAGNGGDFEDDWLPPLPDDDNMNGQNSSFSGFVTTMGSREQMRNS